MQEDCEKQMEAITKANTANVAVCEKAAKSESCHKQLWAGLLSKGGTRANATEARAVREDSKN